MEKSRVKNSHTTPEEEEGEKGLPPPNTKSESMSQWCRDRLNEQRNPVDLKTAHTWTDTEYMTKAV